MYAIKTHLRHCLLWLYDKNNEITGDEAMREIQEVYGPESIKRKTVFNWLKKFRNGEKDVEYLKDEPRSGRPTTVTEIELRRLVEEDPKINIRELASLLNSSIGSVHRRLHSIGLAEKLLLELVKNDNDLQPSTSCEDENLWDDDGSESEMLTMNSGGEMLTMNSGSEMLTMNSGGEMLMMKMNHSTIDLQSLVEGTSALPQQEMKRKLEYSLNDQLKIAKLEGIRAKTDLVTAQLYGQQLDNRMKEFNLMMLEAKFGVQQTVLINEIVHELNPKANPVAPTPPEWNPVAPTPPELKTVAPTPPELNPVAPTPPELNPVAPTPPELKTVAPTPPDLNTVAPIRPELNTLAPTPSELNPVAPTPPELNASKSTPPEMNAAE